VRPRPDHGAVIALRGVGEHLEEDSGVHEGVPDLAGELRSAHNEPIGVGVDFEGQLFEVPRIRLGSSPSRRIIQKEKDFAGASRRPALRR
jgi:hypothetical protein